MSDAADQLAQALRDLINEAVQAAVERERPAPEEPPKTSTMTGRQAVVATLGMRWPQPPMSGAAAQALEHRTGKTFRQPAQDDTAVCR
jgi:hypothetical protein